MRINKFLLFFVLANLNIFAMKTSKQLYEKLCKKVETEITSEMDLEAINLIINEADMIERVIVEESPEQITLNINRAIFNNVESSEKLISIFICRYGLTHSYFSLMLDRIYRQCSKQDGPFSLERHEKLVYSYAERLEILENSLSSEEADWLKIFDLNISSYPYFSYQLIAKDLELRYKFTKLFDEWLDDYDELLNKMVQLIDIILRFPLSANVVDNLNVTKRHLMLILSRGKAFRLDKKNWTPDDEIKKLSKHIKEIQRKIKKYYEKIKKVIDKKITLSKERPDFGGFIDTLSRKLDLIDLKCITYRKILKEFSKDLSFILMSSIFQQNKCTLIINKIYSELIIRYQTLGGKKVFPESLNTLLQNRERNVGLSAFIKNNLILISMINNLAGKATHFKKALSQLSARYLPLQKEMLNQIKNAKKQIAEEGSEEKRAEINAIITQLNQEYRKSVELFKNCKLDFVHTIASTLDPNFLAELKARLLFYKSPENDFFRQTLNHYFETYFLSNKLIIADNDFEYFFNRLFENIINENNFPSYQLTPYFDFIYNVLTNSKFSIEFMHWYPLLFNSDTTHNKNFYDAIDQDEPESHIQELAKEEDSGRSANDVRLPIKSTKTKKTKLREKKIVEKKVIDTKSPETKASCLESGTEEQADPENVIEKPSANIKEESAAAAMATAEDKSTIVVKKRKKRSISITEFFKQKEQRLGIHIPLIETKLKTNNLALLHNFRGHDSQQMMRIVVYCENYVDQNLIDNKYNFIINPNLPKLSDPIGKSWDMFHNFATEVEAKYLSWGIIVDHAHTLKSQLDLRLHENVYAICIRSKILLDDHIQYNEEQLLLAKDDSKFKSIDGYFVYLIDQRANNCFHRFFHRINF